MNTIRTQAAAFAFAAVSTMSILSSMQLLATSAHDDAVVQTATPAAVQVVVVTGKRVAL